MELLIQVYSQQQQIRAYFHAANQWTANLHINIITLSYNSKIDRCDCATHKYYPTKRKNSYPFHIKTNMIWKRQPKLVARLIWWFHVYIISTTNIDLNLATIAWAVCPESVQSHALSNDISYYFLWEMKFNNYNLIAPNKRSQINFFGQSIANRRKKVRLERAKSIVGLHVWQQATT